MFGANGANGGSSLFGVSGSTSTPTSKVASSENTYQPRQKTSSGGLFGSGSGIANGVSTPSPSGGLFGNSSGNNAQTSANILGMNNPNSGSGSLFGSNPTSNNSIQQSGGLFDSTSAAKSSAGATNGLFGQTNDNKNNTISGGNSLFGSSAKTNTNTGGLFGSSTANGLFGGSGGPTNSGAPSGGAASGTSGGLFSNKLSNAGGFGSNTAGTTASAGSLFSASSSQQSQNASSLGSNPYGLQLNSISGNMPPMPDSITSKVYKKEQSSEKKNNSEKSQDSNIFSSNYPTSSNLKSSTTLIGKLSSTLKSARRAQPTQGLFSPASKSILRQELSNHSGDDLKPTERKAFTNSTGTESQNAAKGSNLRKLKIDTNRSASKKLKLLNGSSKPTSMKVLAQRNPISGKETLQTEMNHTPAEEATVTRNVENDQIIGKNSSGSGYWCSPSIDQLLQLPIKQLCSVPDFVIGRQGFGSISFENDVDLSSLIDDLEHNLFGDIVRFHKNRTVEVYPDNTSKPSFGYGLNVPATITLEKVFALEQGSMVPITDYNAKEVQLLIKRLKMQKGMAFISYNPHGGLWTFRVQHFSIWGLVDEEDQNEDQNHKAGLSDRKVAYPKNKVLNKALPNYPNLESTGARSLVTGTTNTSKKILRSFNSEDVSMLNLIDEKQYEPSDVNEEDFYHLEVHSRLSVSDDWDVQLKLAGATANSVFASTEKPHSDTLFPSLEADLKMRKDIKTTLRIQGPIPFVKFSSDSKLLVNSSKSTDGFKIVPVISRDHYRDQKTSETLEACIPRANIGSRPTNGYPLVSRWSVTVEEIGNLISGGNETTLWSLISVLFDTQNPVADSEDNDLREQTRYKKLCYWVAQQIIAIHGMSVAESPNASLFHSLVVGDVIGATKLAIKTRNAHLAGLISLLKVQNGNVNFLAREQLRTWNSLNRTVEPFIIKIYHLLAGDLLDSESSGIISKEHTWLECLSIHLLYGDLKTLSLKEIITKFIQKPFKGGRSESEEVIFRILRFFCSEERDEKLLESAHISQDTQEIWFVMQALRFKQVCQFSNEKTDKITNNFVQQLVAKGLFSEALFCSLFTLNDDLAKQQIDALISKHLEFFSQRSSQRLLKVLKVPPSSFFNGRALHAKYAGDYLGEAENLLEGGLIEAAAKCISLKVGPELVLKGCHDHKSLARLKDLIQRVLEQRITVPQKYLVLFLNYTNFILEDNFEKEQGEKIIQTLPAYYTEYGHFEKASICCSMISSSIALAFLEWHADTTSATDLTDKLLTLPMGEPELTFIRRKIESRANLK
ncbi:nucleocytoplasmic transporter NUP145 LALA0_S13e02564g [Lachancea lanzarotensis]|uniref:LALA0S13e02564g1_1 n=1 Tax=Lachancea lanzarotensis TaxID=1245769 RepID=A0A0C7NEH5_9SACH|nr:uncharacterized protein LALA0_S13e02564g [Lachancea lanzarotensis]CEP64768.1 LALA0S13e02564g1_1 [Lachancea lanzarotensis]